MRRGMEGDLSERVVRSGNGDEIDGTDRPVRAGQRRPDFAGVQAAIASGVSQVCSKGS